jgi:phosphoribosylamine--glycine ligase
MVGAPIVVKADGLAAGKAAIVCQSEEEAIQAVNRIMIEGQFGSAGEQIVVEQCLSGEEASCLAVTDGETIAIVPSCQDHKPVYDGDQGPNTGGMGAYSPAPVVTPALQGVVEREIILQAVHAMNREDRPYKGVIYAGIMVTDEGPRVLEFNCRLGDPETQPLMLRLKSDLVPLLVSAVEGTLDEQEIEWDDRAALCVVMASGGYPKNYQKGLPISGLDEARAMEDVQVFHAGTRYDEQDRVVTDGGRVLGVTARGATIADAQARAYEAVGKIHFEGAHWRRDIGQKAIGRSED